MHARCASALSWEERQPVLGVKSLTQGHVICMSEGVRGGLSPGCAHVLVCIHCVPAL